MVTNVILTQIYSLCFWMYGLKWNNNEMAQNNFWSYNWLTEMKKIPKRSINCQELQLMTYDWSIKQITKIPMIIYPNSHIRQTRCFLISLQADLLCMLVTGELIRPDLAVSSVWGERCRINWKLCKESCLNIASVLEIFWVKNTEFSHFSPFHGIIEHTIV